MLNDSLIRTFIHSFTRFLTTISDNLIINFCQFEDYVGNKNTLRYKNMATMSQFRGRLRL